MNIRLSTVRISLALLVSCACSRVEVIPTQAHHTSDGRFKDPYQTASQKSFFSFLWMRIHTDWVDVSEGHLVPRSMLDPSILSSSKVDQVVWLGHSCFLIQAHGINILTDPVFSDRASPVSFAGPKRYNQAPITINQLPEIHAVVISHNHYDHLDQESIRLIELKSNPIWYVPLKNASLLEEVDVPMNRIKELDWWESSPFSSFKNEVPVKFIATPAQHWSARGLFDRNDMLWSSWVISIGQYQIFFGGDTGYQSKLFTEIGDKLGPFDLAIIPIGAYAPQSFMQYAHVNPFESVKIHQDIQSKKSLGAHWGTFPLTAEAIMDPVNKLKLALKKAQISPRSFIAPILGHPYLLDSLTYWQPSVSK